MKKRDRRQITPSRAPLTVGQPSKDRQKSLDDLLCDAVPESTGPSEKMIDTSSAFYLKGEGTSKKKEEEKSKSGNKDKSYKNHSKMLSSGVFPPNSKNNVEVFGPDNKKLKNTNENRANKWVKNEKAKWLDDKTGQNRKAIQLLQQPLGRGREKQTRVPVLAPDGEPLMPTVSSKARKWIKQGKAKIVQNDMGIFQIQLINEPSDRKKQPIVLLNDPGSRFTGVAVCSKKHILYGYNLELIADEKKNPFASIKYRMDKRRELRRSRRHRNCRRRPARFDNRTKTGKMAPSIRARKQLELKVIKELCDIYPITIIGLEDVSFNHYTKKWGKNFSQVEIGKKWLYDQLKKIPGIKEVKLIKGYDTNIRRQQLKLEKGNKKEEREVIAHVNDCIAMGSIVLGLGIDTKTKLRQGINFDIICRPKYSRRKLHNEKVNPQDKRLTEKGHRQRKRFGGTTTDWTNIRKGDYVEVKHRKKDELRKKGYIPMIYRGWVGGFENDKKLISLYNFDWEVVGQFDHGMVRLLNRNHGLMIKSLEIEEIAHNLTSGGMKQSTVDGTDIDLDTIKRNNDKVKERRKQCEFVDKTVQIGIEDIWD